jgi:molybdate transport system regulatory protein
MTKRESQLGPIEASVTLRRAAMSGVGRDRIRLLQAVAREGSITAGAKAVGLTYKAAWDAIEAMSNLFGRPLLETRTGGRKGGGAQLTATGLQVVEAFDRLESEMARVLRALEPDLAGSGISPRSLVSGYFMRTSARNGLRGRISDIRSDTLNAEVSVAVAEGNTVHALVTSESVRELGLCVGREVVVLVKATFIIIAPGHEAPKVSARNCLTGIVKRSDVGTVNAEVTLDIGGGKSVTAMITAASCEALNLQPGSPACALFDAAHVILAID